MQRDKVITIMSISLLICFSGCGQQSGNTPLGVTGGGNNGYGSLGENHTSGGPDARQILGTWRDNLDSRYYHQYRFSENDTCEVWIVGDQEVHFEAHYSIQNSHNINTLLITFHGEVFLDAEFYFDEDDLIFIGEGGNSIFHRVG